MKTECITPQKTFKPIEVKLTFEKREELDDFIKLMSMDIRVPMFVKQENEIKSASTLSSVMSNVYKGIYLL